jgi:putative colanic acid biosynthesis glycosyltransferase
MLSIITVNLNNKEGLKKTLDSVACQSSEGFEQIVIDGGSEDGSTELLQKTDKNYLSYYSERDNGIYDAMNKGIIRAKGEWIYFLNSGDYFANNQVLADILSIKNISKKDVIYGHTIIKDEKSEQLSKVSELCTFFYKLPFSHQAVFVKRKLMLKWPFDTTYKISSDYDFFCRLYSSGNKFHNSGKVIAVRSEGGISSTNTEEMYSEYDIISRKWFKGFKRMLMKAEYRIHVAGRKINRIAGMNK